MAAAKYHLTPRLTQGTNICQLYILTNVNFHVILFSLCTRSLNVLTMNLAHRATPYITVHNIALFSTIAVIPEDLSDPYITVHNIALFSTIAVIQEDLSNPYITVHNIALFSTIAVIPEDLSDPYITVHNIALFSTMAVIPEDLSDPPFRWNYTQNACVVTFINKCEVTVETTTTFVSARFKETMNTCTRADSVKYFFPLLGIDERHRASFHNY